MGKKGKNTKVERNAPTDNGAPGIAKPSEPETIVLSADHNDTPTQTTDVPHSRTLAKCSQQSRKAIPSVSARRRSQRLLHASMDAQTAEIKHMIQEVTLTESSDDEEEPHADEQVPVTSFPSFNLEEENFPYVLRAHQTDIDDLKFKMAKISGDTSCSRNARVTYKSLYFDAQKKIEALVEENNQLAVNALESQKKNEALNELLVKNNLDSQKKIEALNEQLDKNAFDSQKKIEDLNQQVTKTVVDCQKKIDALIEEKNELTSRLENALGKVEVYEKGMYFSLGKATEAAAKTPAEAIRGAALTSSDIDLDCKTYAKKRKNK